MSLDKQHCQYYGADGSVREIAASFDEARKVIGGYVEVVRVNDGVLLVDEDGLCKQLSFNKLASALVGQPLVGGVVWVPKKLVKKVLG